MSKYKIKIILENESGEIVNEREKEIKVKDNNFNDIDLELFKLKNEIIPEIEGNIFKVILGNKRIRCFSLLIEKILNSAPSMHTGITSAPTA